MTQADSIQYRQPNDQVRASNAAIKDDSHTQALHADAYESWRSQPVPADAATGYAPGPWENGGWKPVQSSSGDLPTGYNWETEMPTAGGGISQPNSGFDGGNTGISGGGFVPERYRNECPTSDQDGTQPSEQTAQQLFQTVEEVDPNFAQALGTYQNQLSLQGFIGLEQLDLTNAQMGGTISDSDMIRLAAGSNLFSTSDTAVMQNLILPSLELQDTDADVSTAGVDQGSHGDCVFEASMAAVANTPNGQNLIKDMITTNPDGSYTVTFPGDASHPVTVTQQDIDNEGVKDSSQWGKILETAMLENYPELAKGTTPKDAPGGTDGNPPSPAQYALYLLTGNSATKTNASDSSIASQLEQAMNNKQPVTAFCANDDNGALVSGHEWTVEQYDPTTQTVTLRNPWGSNPTSDASKSGVTNIGDGQVQMSLQTFQKDYQEVTFANVS